MRPGVEITSKAARPATGTPTANGAWFVVGLAEQGPQGEAVRVTSLEEYRERFGGRVAYGLLNDSLEAAFADGLAEAWVSRVLGPNPVKASLTLVDRAGVPVNTLRIDARDFGDYANGAATGGLAVEVQDGTDASTFRLIIWQRAADGTYSEVERHDNLVMDTAGARYAPTVLEASEYVRGADLNSATASPNDNPAVTARTNLAGGTDDRAAVTDAEWLTALNALTADLGPGQVSMPGRTTGTAHADLVAHAAARNRTAVLDTGDKATRAAMVAAVQAVDDLPGAPYAGIFGGWLDIPGLTAGTTRAVPPSAGAAALMARLDATSGTSGHAPAGEQGRLSYALGVRQPAAGALVDADYDALNDEGVNMMRQFRFAGVQLYGFRSVSNDTEWVQLTANRLRVSLTARLEAIARAFVFRTIDGRGLVFAELNGALAGECMKDFQANALFGDPSDPDNPEKAFRVDTGAGVNTAATIAAGEIKAAVHARFAPYAELVRIDITKVPTTAPVG